jgi:hypothetical protein
VFSKTCSFLIYILLVFSVLISYPVCYYEYSREDREDVLILTMKRNYFFGTCNENVRVYRIINTKKEIKIKFSEGEMEGQEWHFYPY